MVTEVWGRDKECGVRDDSWVSGLTNSTHSGFSSSRSLEKIQVLRGKSWVGFWNCWFGGFWGFLCRPPSFTSLIQILHRPGPLSPPYLEFQYSSNISYPLLCFTFYLSSSYHLGISQVFFLLLCFTCENKLHEKGIFVYFIYCYNPQHLELCLV